MHLVCSFVFAGLLSGQSFRFRNYGPGDNLPSNMIYTINGAGTVISDWNHTGYLKV